jgi:hypothetical protein
VLIYSCLQVNIGSVEHFHDYSGAPSSYDEGIKYFLNRFLAVNKQEERGRTCILPKTELISFAPEIFFHVTCDTDTSRIRFILNTCSFFILSRNCEIMGTRDRC